MIEWKEGFFDLRGVIFWVPNDMFLEPEENVENRVHLYPSDQSFRITIEKNAPCLPPREELEQRLQNRGCWPEAPIAPVRCGALEGHRLWYHWGSDHILEMHFDLGGSLREGVTVILDSRKDLQDVCRDPRIVAILESLKTK